MINLDAKKEFYDTSLYVILGLSFLFILLLTDTLSYKVIKIGGILFTLPGFIYPLTYPINDVLVELWSIKKASLIIVSSIIFEQLFDILISLSSKIPNPIFVNYGVHFNYALGHLYLAGFGVLLGELGGYFLNTYTHR